MKLKATVYCLFTEKRLYKDFIWPYIE